MIKWMLIGIAGVVSAFGALLGAAFYAIAKDARRGGWPEPAEDTGLPGSEYARQQGMRELQDRLRADRQQRERVENERKLRDDR
jgi:hypothetical protein